MKQSKKLLHPSFGPPEEIYAFTYQGLPITGWKCVVCGENATVHGDGWTMCWVHWGRYDLGHGKTIRQMIEEHKNCEEKE